MTDLQLIVVYILIVSACSFVAFIVGLEKGKTKGRAIGISAAWNVYKRDKQAGLKSLWSTEGVEAYWKERDSK